jgi:hypothetical protein
MKCNGEWLKGSGSHIVWSHDCDTKPVIVDVETGEMFCYDHIPRKADGGVHPAFEWTLAPIGSLVHERAKAVAAVHDAIDSLGWPGKVVRFLGRVIEMFSR